MPSRPSLARTVRKDAGTDTRPFVSILFVKAETNWSISPSRHLTDWKTEANAKVRDRCPRIEDRGRGGAGPPVASKGALPASPTTHRTGKSWDSMGYYGWSRNLMEIALTRAGFSV